MVDYVETPWDPIIAVHWAGSATPCTATEFCNSNGYGWGARIESGVIVPYGPDRFPPFVGTFNTTGNNGTGGAYGGLLNPYVDADGNLIAPTLESEMDIAKVMTLNASGLIFEDEFLRTLDNGAGGNANELWRVPMAEGARCVARRLGDDSHPPFFPDPLVDRNYKIDVAWQCGHCDPKDQFAWTITHPGHEDADGNPVFEPLWPPGADESQPLFGPFLLSGGAHSFTYEFKYKTWHEAVIAGNLSGHPYAITDENFNDLSIGGPILLWSMIRTYNSGTDTYSAWEPFISPDHLLFATKFMADVLIDEGDWATWHITPTCVVERDAS